MRRGRPVALYVFDHQVYVHALGHQSLRRHHLDAPCVAIDGVEQVAAALGLAVEVEEDLVEWRAARVCRVAVEADSQGVVFVDFYLLYRHLRHWPHAQLQAAVVERRHASDIEILLVEPDEEIVCRHVPQTGLFG